MNEPTCAREGCGERRWRDRTICHRHVLDEINARRAARRAAVVKTCPRCAVEFSPAKSLKRIYCTAECSRRAGRESKSSTCSDSACDRPCLARGLCKMHYRRVARAEGREKAPVWDDRRAARHQARRALTKGAPEVEVFTSREVYERDQWRCGICAEVVDETLSWPDPHSPSLDHVVPLSKGGTHTLDNVQCAHLVCNLQKGATLAA